MIIHLTKADCVRTSQVLDQRLAHKRALAVREAQMREVCAQLLCAQNVATAREQQLASQAEAHGTEAAAQVAAHAAERLAHGQAHNQTLLEQLAASEAAAHEEAKAHALRHQHVLRELKGTKEALESYMIFQAKEGGAYKESVRMCYYQLINLKVPEERRGRVEGGE